MNTWLLLASLKYRIVKGACIGISETNTPSKSSPACDERCSGRDHVINKISRQRLRWSCNADDRISSTARPGKPRNLRRYADSTGRVRATAHMTRAVVTNWAIGRANVRFAEILALLAGTGMRQKGPTMSAAIAGAAIWMAFSVGILSSWAI